MGLIHEGQVEVVLLGPPKQRVMKRRDTTSLIKLCHLELAIYIKTYILVCRCKFNHQEMHVQDKPQRVTFDVERDLHKRIKIACIEHGMSMRKLIMEAIEEKLAQLKSK